MEREREQNRFRDLLRSYIGRGLIPVDMAAELTGISERRIYSHIAHDGSLPNSDDMLAYIKLLGPEFLNQWTQAVGITGAHRPKSIEGEKFLVTLETQHIVGGCLNDLLTWTADGKIDHIEDRLVPKALTASAIHMLAVAANYRELRA